jgi:hypothetical protein
MCIYSTAREKTTRAERGMELLCIVYIIIPTHPLCQKVLRKKKEGKREKRQLLSIIKTPAPFSNERITGQKKAKERKRPGNHSLSQNEGV